MATVYAQTWEGNSCDFEKAYFKWLDEFDALFDGLGNVKQIDLLHLEGLGCIRFETGSYSLKNEVRRRFGIDDSVPIRAHCNWSRLGAMWHEGEGLEHCFPTSTGILIGTLYNDKLQGLRTKLNW